MNIQNRQNINFENFYKLLKPFRGQYIYINRKKNNQNKETSPALLTIMSTLGKVFNI